MQQTREAWPAPTLARAIRVLIVDDNPADRCLYRRHLEGIDGRFFEVTEVETAESAGKMLRENHFDCILLDYRLPRIDGLDYLELLQASSNTNEIPVILITGEGDETLAVKSLRKGAADYLAKDRVSPKTFKKVIDNALSAVETRRKASSQERGLMDAIDDLRFRNSELQYVVRNASEDARDALEQLRQQLAQLLDGSAGDLSEPQREILLAARNHCDETFRHIDSASRCVQPDRDGQ